MRTKKEEDRMPEFSLTRRSFIKGGTGAVIIASCLSAVTPAGKGFEFQSPQAVGKNVYVCPPCGLDCDKLTFDQPGTCPQCGMTLVRADGTGGPPVVSVLLFDGAEIIDFAGPWEAFGTAGYLVHSVAENLDPHTMVFGQKVVADYTFENCPKSDVLLVPGGGVSKVASDDRVIQWIRTKFAGVRYVMSVCTGAFLLAKAGLLDGLDATVTYGMEGDLAKAGKNINVLSPRRFVDTGKIITTAGLSSGIDGALHLISKIDGLGSAQSAALGMEYHWTEKAGFSRAALADRYLPDGLQYGNARLRGAKAEMLSTDGDTDHWEVRILVSEPGSPAEIADLLRKRIAANTGGGSMSSGSRNRGTPHFSSTPTAKQTKTSEVRWNFTDDQGHSWIGNATVKPAPDPKGRFILQIRVARELRNAGLRQE